MARRLLFVVLLLLLGGCSKTAPTFLGVPFYNEEGDESLFPRQLAEQCGFEIVGDTVAYGTAYGHPCALNLAYNSMTYLPPYPSTIQAANLRVDWCFDEGATLEEQVALITDIYEGAKAEYGQPWAIYEDWNDPLYKTISFVQRGYKRIVGNMVILIDLLEFGLVEHESPCVRLEAFYNYPASHDFKSYCFPPGNYIRQVMNELINARSK